MSRLIKQLTLCAALCLAFGSTAYAAPQDTPAQGTNGPWHGQGGPWHRGHGPHDPWQIVFELHDELKLTPAQEQQLQAHKAQSQAEHEQQRAAFEQARGQVKALMQAPVLDLRALSAVRTQMEEQAHKAHQQNEEALLNFYDTLNTDQKTLISTFIKVHWKEMEAHHDKMAPHWHKKPEGAASQPQ